MLIAGGTLLAVVGLLAWGLLARPKPLRHKRLTPEKLRSLLRTLLVHGRPGSLLVIQVRNATAFVQFRVIQKRRRKAIEAGFPRAPWSEEVFERVVADLGQRGIPVHRQSERGAEVTEFVLGDFGSDFEGAQEHATYVIREILGVDPEQACFATLEGDFNDRPA